MASRDMASRDMASRDMASRDSFTTTYTDHERIHVFSRPVLDEEDVQCKMLTKLPMMTDVETTSKLFMTTSGRWLPQPGNDTPIDGSLSDEARQVLELVFVVLVNGVLSFVGSVVNVINIIIFFRQGFNVSVNIGLCGLAISDVGSMLALVWKSVCFNPLLRYSDIDVDFVEFQYLTAGWPHRCFVGISIWLTALITFERCVCIALPLKVTDIISPKRTFIVVVVIFLAMFAIVAPVFTYAEVAPLFNVARNKTILGLSFTSSGRILQSLSQTNLVCIQLSSFIIVIICTLILMYNLVIKSMWRNKAKAVSKLDAMSSRDMRVVKMVAFSACIFIVCFFPSTVTMLMVVFYPDYSIGGDNVDSFQVIWAICGTLEAGNCSATILIYYSMSSKYRDLFNSLFQRKV